MVVEDGFDATSFWLRTAASTVSFLLAFAVLRAWRPRDNEANLRVSVPSKLSGFCRFWLFVWPVWAGLGFFLFYFKGICDVISKKNSDCSSTLAFFLLSFPRKLTKPFACRLIATCA
jgi:hypothetical protein